MRIALIVGINHYNHGGKLYGCVNDANSVYGALKHHDDGSKNFDCLLLTSPDQQNIVRRTDLKDRISSLFEKDAEIALFYFAGHGHVEATGGYLRASDSSRGDEGIALDVVLEYANESPAKNKVIILDSCHSGIAGNSPNSRNKSMISEGVTVLTASTQEQYASEKDGHGVFSTLLVDALRGSAANLIGDITLGSIYSHIDQSLGPWEQRPVFKTNIKQFVSLRKAKPPISIEELRLLATYFPSPDFTFKLDPTYEPEERGRFSNMPAPITENTKVFSILQKYNRLNLLVPVGASHMWEAAMESKSCKLTVTGKHYRNLVEKNRI